MAKQHLEIERRWLLTGLPDAEILEARDVEWTERATVYLIRDRDLEVRIRRQSGNGEITYSVVTKVGAGLTRQESPKLSVSADIFNYYDIAQGKPCLYKNHWKIPFFSRSGQKLEISRFNQPKLKGLILAEIEFENGETANSFGENDFPAWLRSLIVKEVTDDPRYNGKNLAVHGRPDPE